MRGIFMRLARWAVVPILVFLGISTGGADGMVGWFVLAWMLYRAAPGMWSDVRRAYGFLRGRRWAFGRRSVGGGLNV